LESFPERGRIVPEFADGQFREVILQNYRLLYHLADDAIFVMGFVHGARDLGTLWRRESRRLSPFD
jgi:hypothetical protein